ncbi:MAG: carbamoyl-phosphate synthase large subunit [Candidatus Firestonebacteria bacterium]
MPKRTDIKKILLIGSGPIVIGQACEFDYSGTQACKALKEEGYEVVLVNSNPATIMTDPEFADSTYIEPVTAEMVAKIIEKERPDALLPTIGGQTGLNVAVELAEKGILAKFNVELIGAKIEAIKKAEDRILFKEAVEKIGLSVPLSFPAYSVEDAVNHSKELGFPVIIRPAFTLGGSGSSIAYNLEELKEKVKVGIEASMIHQVLLEQSVIGWKEYELEVMRDLKDNVVIICPIENFDPMGIHTGDSVTVAPAQTLTDKEYQILRDASIAIMREIGVDTGGSNVQFGINPDNGKVVVIEMNPRVSRSSALASKATGFPIAKIAAKLAVGFTLDEIPNDITKYTCAAFEPTIDYVVTKIPRWTFEKFPGADEVLGTQMKSVGEVMAIGRTFKESFQKAIRSLEIDRYSLYFTDQRPSKEEIYEKLRTPNCDRIYYIREAFKNKIDIEEVFNCTKIDRWFLANMKELVDMEDIIVNAKNKKKELPLVIREAKKNGFSDRYLAKLLGMKESEVRKFRLKHKITPVYKMVDTCASEFEAFTPYLYSTYEEEDEALPTKRKKIAILGGGPNRIGQGIEFDYCCVHAAFALKEDGFEVIMINCNPETVSTDYDTSDRLYFEPLTFEDTLSILNREKPEGVIVQFGGQTPLKLALPLYKEKIKIIGTSPKSIDIAEDRKLFGALLNKHKIPQPENGTARTIKEAIKVARSIGFPVLVRPSYVLGGRAMEIVYDEESMENFVKMAISVSGEHPVLIDKFLEDAGEIDVDAICDGETTFICGIMEHIEEAGIHSGDSACVIPAFSLAENQLDTIRKYTYTLAKELKVIGLMNIQYACKGDMIYVLEVNPRASRTVPFVSKVTGIPWAKVAARVMSGKTLKEQGITKEITPKHFSVKESVFPFVKFQGVDSVLGPEMKSTGEVMGIDADFGRAFAKSQIAASASLPKEGTVFVSVKNKDKRNIIYVAKQLADLGFKLMATKGTAETLSKNGLEVKFVNKVGEGRPNIVDAIRNKEVSLIINTPTGKGPKTDEYHIRRAAINYGVPCITTVSGAQAAVNGIESILKGELNVKSLQEYHSVKK